MKRVHPINGDHDMMRRHGCGQDRNHANKKGQQSLSGSSSWGGEEILRPENQNTLVA